MKFIFEICLWTPLWKSQVFPKEAYWSINFESLQPHRNVISTGIRRGNSNPRQIYIIHHWLMVSTVRTNMHYTLWFGTYSATYRLRSAYCWAGNVSLACQHSMAIITHEIFHIYIRIIFKEWSSLNLLCFGQNKMVNCLQMTLSWNTIFIELHWFFTHLYVSTIKIINDNPICL